VNGKWVETGLTFPKINPVNGTKVCDVSEADQATVARAVDAAGTAMSGEWGRLSAADRAALLQVADRVELRSDDFLEAEIADTGHSCRNRCAHGRGRHAVHADLSFCQLFAQRFGEPDYRFMLSKIPLGRFGALDEVASLVCWLASEEASFSTGAVFDASGGRATY
jgi:acyl-CoA reductase-like NAD-dependent aldehyde dehydrogenase